MQTHTYTIIKYYLGLNKSFSKNLIQESCFQLCEAVTFYVTLMF